MRTASLAGGPATRAIHQDVSHRHGSDGEKVGAIMPVRVLRARELEIELVHQCGRGQRITRPYGELAPRGTAKLLVDQREDLIERFTTTATQVGKQLRDARLVLRQLV